MARTTESKLDKENLGSSLHDRLCENMPRLRSKKPKLTPKRSSKSNENTEPTHIRRSARLKKIREKSQKKKGKTEISKLMPKRTFLGNLTGALRVASTRSAKSNINSKNAENHEKAGTKPSFENRKASSKKTKSFVVPDYIKNFDAQKLLNNKKSESQKLKEMKDKEWSDTAKISQGDSNDQTISNITVVVSNECEAGNCSDVTMEICDDLDDDDEVVFNVKDTNDKKYDDNEVHFDLNKADDDEIQFNLSSTDSATTEVVFNHRSRNPNESEHSTRSRFPVNYSKHNMSNDQTILPSIQYARRTSSGSTSSGDVTIGNSSDRSAALNSSNNSNQGTQRHASTPLSHTHSTPFFGSNCKVFTVNSKSYTSLKLIGRGGSSKVFKVIDSNGDLFALKRIKIKDRADRNIASHRNEINLLKRLAGESGIVQLIDSQIDLQRGEVLMVMEMGEIDLKNWMLNNRNNRKVLDQNHVRVLWLQMLKAVETIHQHRIVHGDLKPANFLFVKGDLKLIDFGIAKEISNDTTNIHRDSQIGTINYMAPEALAEVKSNGGLKLGRSSDVWSLGCILYELVHGRPPFHALSLIQKLKAITNPNHKINFPKVDDASLANVLVHCLQRNPSRRPSINGSSGLIQHPFLHPSSKRQSISCSGLGKPQRVSTNSNSKYMVKHIHSLLQQVCKLSKNQLKKCSENQEIALEIAKGLQATGNIDLSEAMKKCMDVRESKSPAPKSQRVTRSSSKKVSVPSSTTKSSTKRKRASGKLHKDSKKAAKRPIKKLRSLPPSLKDAICESKTKLKTLKESKSSRLMKPVKKEEGFLRTHIMERFCSLNGALEDDDEDNTYDVSDWTL